MLIPEWLLALSITLFILDIFVAGEWLTWLSIIALSFYITWRIDPPLIWGIVTTITVFCTTVTLYYIFLRRCIQKLVRRTILRNAPEEVIERIVGQKAVIRIVNGTPFVKWNGELWSIAGSTQNTSLQNGLIVTIKGIKDGNVVL